MDNYRIISRDWAPKDHDPREAIRTAQQSNATKTADLLAELVDNAIDSGADSIVVTINQKAKTFAIVDNGSGLDQPDTLLRMGESTRRYDPNMIGFFGVGAKDCINGVGGLTSTLLMESAIRGRGWRSRIEWAHQSNMRTDQIECPLDDLQLLGHSGLRMEMLNCYKSLPTAKSWIDHVSRIYWPWLEKLSRRLTINGESVLAPQAPEHDGSASRDDIIDAGDGRFLAIEGGLLRERGHTLSGVTVIHGNRAIKVASGFGCESAPSSQSGIFVVVRLSGAWSKERNKSGLAEPDQDLLEDCVAAAIEALLKAAQEKGRSLDDDDLLQALNERLDSTLGQPIRPGKTGTKSTRNVSLVKTERKVTRATQVRGKGSAAGDGGTGRGGRDRRLRPWTIVRVQGDPFTLGEVSLEDRTIKLRMNNESIMTLWERSEQECLLVVAGALLAWARSNAEPDPRLPPLPFEQDLGNLLHRVLAGKSATIASLDATAHTNRP